MHWPVAGRADLGRPGWSALPAGGGDSAAREALPQAVDAAGGTEASLLHTYAPAGRNRYTHTPLPAETARFTATLRR